MSTTTPNRSLHKVDDADNVETSAVTLFSENMDILDDHHHNASDITAGTIPPAQLGAGTPTGTTVLTGDGNWTDTTAMLALQQKSAVAITGGTITGITDVAVADGGTGASTAANARTNLGLGNVTNFDQTNAANLTSGLVVPARLGSGAGSSGLTIPADDNTWKSIGAWGNYTPTLTCPGGVNPTLGSGSHALGRYIQVGKFVYFAFDIVWGTSGVVQGSGTFKVSLPVTAATPLTTAGASSEQIGTGLILRGYSGDVLGPPGAHQRVEWHIQSGDNISVLGVLPHSTPYDFQVAEGTNADAVSATTDKDITGASISITVKQSNSNYRIIGTTPWYTSTNNTTMYLKIREGSTTLRQGASHLATAGTSVTNQNTARVEYILVNPTLGTHTYKLTAFADQACTIAYDNANHQYPRIDSQQLPYNATGEYMGSDNPWDWSEALSIGKNMWCRGVYEAA